MQLKYANELTSCTVHLAGPFPQLLKVRSQATKQARSQPQFLGANEFLGAMNKILGSAPYITTRIIK